MKNLGLVLFGIFLGAVSFAFAFYVLVYGGL
jgi:hypothetical protein